MKLKIVSQGTPETTKVLTEDGKTIEGVTHIRWGCEVGGIAYADIRIVGAKAFLEAAKATFEMKANESH